MAASLAATDLTRVKAYMGESGTGSDDAIEVWIPVVSEAIERYLNRSLLKDARVEIVPRVRPFTKVVAVLAPPIDTAEAIEVIEASDRDFGSATALDAANYFVDGPAGLVLPDTPFNDGGRRDARGTVRISYTGGLAVDLDALEADYPSIVQAANIEVQYRYDSRSRVGKDSESLGGAAVTLSAERALPQCAEARSLLDTYRIRVANG